MTDCQMFGSEMDYFMQELEQHSYEKKIPLKGTFELTARCNFNCKMCYVHLNETQISDIGRELSNEEWLDLARQARDAGMLFLTLTGGEVFARPGFRELYEALTEMGFLISILSNGSLIDENVVEWLKKTPPYILRLTLYGASNETYENVCGIKNGFDRVAKAVDLLKEAEIPFFTVGTIIKENEHEFEAICKFALEKNVRFKGTTSVLQAVRGATQDVKAHRIDYVKRYEKELVHQGLLNLSDKRVDNIFDACGAYRNGFWVTWNGKLQLCTFTEEPCVSILNHTFKAAWEDLLLTLEGLKGPEQCIDCKYSNYCVRCPGILAAECGSCSKVTEEFCSKTKEIYELHQREEADT